MPSRKRRGVFPEGTLFVPRRDDKPESSCSPRRRYFPGKDDIVAPAALRNGPQARERVGRSAYRENHFPRGDGIGPGTRSQPSLEGAPAPDPFRRPCQASDPPQVDRAYIVSCGNLARIHKVAIHSTCVPRCGSGYIVLPGKDRVLAMGIRTGTSPPPFQERHTALVEEATGAPREYSNRIARVRGPRASFLARASSTTITVHRLVYTSCLCPTDAVHGDQ